MSQKVDGVRWVPRDNLHVTLKFIGPCQPEKIPDLSEWMRKAAKNLPIELDIRGLGGFPSSASARVIWVGSVGPPGAVEKVYNVLDKGARECGFGREKRAYRPHVTIGRARKSPVRLPPGDIERLGSEPGVLMRVGEIVLYQSILSSAGAEYIVIDRAGPDGRS